MKVLVVLSALVAFAAAASLTSTELELLHAFDYDTLLANEELRNIAFQPSNSWRVITNQCAECSPAQKTTYDNLLKLLHDKYEPFYNELMKKTAANKE